MVDTSVPFSYIRRIALVDCFDAVYPELYRQHPGFYERLTKEKTFNIFSDLYTYGVYKPGVDDLIGIFWRNPADNEVHVLIFEAWRRRWPLRKACAQLFDIWFAECDEIYAKIPVIYPEAMRFFAFLGAEQEGFVKVEADIGVSLDYYRYRMTAAMRHL